MNYHLISIVDHAEYSIIKSQQYKL